MNAWSRWETGAAIGFMLVALANLSRFGPGVEMLAGVAAAAVVLLPRQWGQYTPQASWFVAPIAVVGLQAKMVGGCQSCGPTSFAGSALTTVAGISQLGAALLGVLAIMALIFLRLNPAARVGIALAVFVGHGALAMAWPSVCIACLLTAFAVAGLAQADAPPSFAGTLTFRGLTATVGALSALTAVIAGAGGYQRPQGNLASGDANSLPARLLDRLDVADGTIVVLSAPGCGACQAAEQYLQSNHLSWVIRYPCDGLRSRGCWYTPASSWRLPTVLRREGEYYQVLSRGFSAKQWSAIR